MFCFAVIDAIILQKKIKGYYNLHLYYYANTCSTVTSRHFKFHKGIL